MSSESEAVIPSGSGSAPASQGGDGTPRAAYAARLAWHEGERRRLDGLDRRVATSRGLVFAGGLVLLWMGLGPGWAPPWAWLVALAGFLALVAIHGSVLARRGRVDRAIAWHKVALGRLDEIPPPGDGGAALAPAGHPYARDLDLFGPGSLFAFLSSARTRPGQERLAAWLLAPATPAEIRARQEAVAELRDRVALREELALLGDDVEADVRAGELVAWGEGQVAPPVGAAGALGLVTLSLATAASLGAWLAVGATPLPAVLTIALSVAVHRALGARVAAAQRAVEGAERALALVGALITRLEAERLASAKASALQAGLAGAPAAIGELERLVRLLGWQRNQIFTPVALLCFWGAQVGRPIAAWRHRHGARIAGWLDGLAELEALLSLSTYAFERPDETTAELVDGEALVVEATGLCHPLLPRAHAIRNDLALGGEAPRLLVVSGSNMSGKSTLLRSLGVNVVLALAGAPVRARRLRLARAQVGASIRAEDSLRDGVSRFYAEVKRLRQLADLAAASPPPLLFLCDELLAGTNSHDRRVGAAAVVGALVRRGAGGLVTTHDLALAELAPELGATNVHFEDQVVEAPAGGEAPDAANPLRFDYTLRPGPIDARRTNALRLMRAVGLPVDE